MRKLDKSKSVKSPYGSRNWEDNIRSVVIEPCDESEDPVGYKAIFYLTFEAAKKTQRKTFEVGASFLAQRKHSLTKAGYKVPMTAKAIEKVEAKIGKSLPIFLGGQGVPVGAERFA